MQIKPKHKMLSKYTIISRLAVIIFLATFLQIEVVHAQNTSLGRNNWFVGISPGMVSYFGDLSQYDYNPVNKIIHETGPSIGFFAGKKLTTFLELGLVGTLGKVSSQRKDWDKEFLNRFNEFGIYSALSIANIVNPRRRSRFDYGLMANYSFTQWRSVSYKTSDQIIILSNGLDTDGNKLGDGETTNHFGAGYYVGYALSTRFSIRLSQTMQLLNTDHFDSFEGQANTNINDRILITGIGLILNIGSGRSARNDFEECPTFN